MLVAACGIFHCDVLVPEGRGSVVVACRLSCSAECRVLVPWPGIELEFTARQVGFLTTGPWGKSLQLLKVLILSRVLTTYFLRGLLSPVALQKICNYLNHLILKEPGTQLLQTDVVLKNLLDPVIYHPEHCPFGLMKFILSTAECPGWKRTHVIRIRAVCLLGFFERSLFKG